MIGFIYYILRFNNIKNTKGDFIPLNPTPFLWAHERKGEKEMRPVSHSLTFFRACGTHLRLRLRLTFYSL